MTVEAIDVGAIIDRQKMKWFQIRVVVLCALMQFLDGFDTQAIAYVAPALKHAWHLGQASLGPVFGSGVAGVLVGSILIGPLADRFGRKAMMILAVAVFGVFTLLTAQAGTLNMLLVLRFLAGLGLGGVIPSTVVMASEYAPGHRRGSMVTLMACGFALGAASGGILAGAYLLSMGWRAIFYVGGILPLLLVLVLVRWLPESLRFLSLDPVGKRPKILAILRQIEPTVAYPDHVQFVSEQRGAVRWPVIELFRERRAAMTCLLWLIFFVNLVCLNFLNNWLPTLMSATMSVHDAVRTTTFFQFGGMAGVICMGILADRFGFYRVMTLGFAVATVLVATIGGVIGSRETMSLVLALSGFCIIGVQMTLSALTATLYPTSMRGTGTGWANSIGRIGSFAGPVVGGVLLSLHLPLQTVFLIVALPALCGVAFTLILAGLMSKRRRRSEAEALVTPTGIS
jgi:AAHS family 4-hydroxybenzoate transporter-like MFS transporter